MAEPRGRVRRGRRERVVTVAAVAVPAAAAVMLIFAMVLTGEQGDAVKLPAWLPWAAWAGAVTGLVVLLVLLVWVAWRVSVEAAGYRLPDEGDELWPRTSAAALATFLLCVMTLSLVPSW